MKDFIKHKIRENIENNQISQYKSWLSSVVKPVKINPINNIVSVDPSDMYNNIEKYQKNIALSKAIKNFVIENVEPNECFHNSGKALQFFKNQGFDVSFVLGILIENGKKFGHAWNKINGVNYDFSRKGMDQTLLNHKVYPCYGNRDNPSIIQHYLLGIGQTFLDGYRNQIPNIEVEGVSREMEESNGASEHIGMAGWNNVPLFAFLRKHKDKFEDLRAIEKSFTNVAYWINDGTL